MMRKTKTATSLDDECSEAMIAWAEHWAKVQWDEHELAEELQYGGVSAETSVKAARVLDLLGRIGQKLTKRAKRSGKRGEVALTARKSISRQADKKGAR